MTTPLASIWIEITKASLTPIVAFFAVAIAYRQWQISRQKLVIDLFEKRFAIYTELDNALHSVLRHGNFTSEELSAVARAVIKSRFLFGQDIRQRLDKLWDDAVWQNNRYGRPKTHEPNFSEKEEKRNEEIFQSVHDWVKKSDRWFAPYMRLDQRLP